MTDSNNSVLIQYLTDLDPSALTAYQTTSLEIQLVTFLVVVVILAFK